MSIESYNGNLNIPRYVATRAFLEIAANLLESPILRQGATPPGIKTWVIPGREMDLPAAAWDPNFVVPAELCPVLLLWPEPADGQPITNSRQQATLNVAIRLWVATLDPLDCMDLYGAIESVLLKGTVADGRTLQQRLGSITGWSGSIDLGQPAIVRYPSTGGAVMLAEGSVSTKYNIPSF